MRTTIRCSEMMRCELCIPPLSSVDTDQQRIGYEAAAVLDRMMSGRKPPQEPILVAPRQVTVRQSSDTLAVTDPEVAKVLSEIRQRGGVDISVAEIVELVGLSRRTLQLRMRAAIGRTMLQEISRVRTERIKRLLTQADMSFPRIAEATGFASVARMAGFFRSHTGTTLAGYRKRFGWA
jgi:LacI family transcriptional regulator